MTTIESAVAAPSTCSEAAVTIPLENSAPNVQVNSPVLTEPDCMSSVRIAALAEIVPALRNAVAVIESEDDIPPQVKLPDEFKSDIVSEPAVTGPVLIDCDWNEVDIVAVLAVKP